MANRVVDSGSAGAKPSPRPRIRLSPVGFWSYTRRDDDFSRGRLSQLRSLVLAEIQTQYGRDDVQLFQDVGAIPDGADWEQVTTDAIRQASFFIPIVTPNYIQSPWCARETKMFAARVEAMFESHPDLPRDRLRMFPLLWIPVEGIEPIDETAAAALGAPQWSNFSKLRHRNLEQDEEVLAKIAAFAKSIVEVLQLRVEAPLSEEEKERIAREAEEASLRVEEERRRQAAESEAVELRQATARIEAERLAEAQRQADAAERAEAARLAEEQRLAEAAERAEAEAERERLEAAVQAERQRLEAERERVAAERRARQAEAFAALLQRLKRAARWLPLLLVAVVAALGLSYLLSGSPPARETPAPQSPPIAVAPTRPAAPRPPSAEWLFRQWSIQGNCRNPWTISREGNTIVSVSATEREVETIDRISEAEVRTDRNLYRRNGANVDVVNETYPYQLRPC
jgi:hypothetical protein